MPKITIEGVHKKLESEYQALLAFLPTCGEFEFLQQDDDDPLPTLSTLSRFINVYTRIGKCPKEKIQKILEDHGLTALLTGDDRFLAYLAQTILD